MTRSADRGAFWLWAATALLVVNSAFLATAGAVGRLGVAYLTNLLLHVALGLALLPAFAVWWWRRRRPQTWWRRGLDLGGLLLPAAGLAGVALLVLGNRAALRPLLWSHVALAVAGLFALLLAAAASPRRALWWLSAAAGLLALLVPGLAHFAPGRNAGTPPDFNARTPRTLAEEAMGGAAGPFYPSALRTRHGGTLPARELSESQSCGRSGCHADVVAEWSASAHRFSGLDNPWYRRTYEEMRRTTGVVPARWCGGCHTPALLAAGGMDRPVAEIAGMPAGTAGVSCTVCHASRVRSSRGQADLELGPSSLQSMATSPRSLVRTLHDLLVRIDPEPHRRLYSRFRVAGSSSELCSTCHKAHLEGPLNGDHFQMVMNDYDPWQTTSASGQGVTLSIYFPPSHSCADCHMPRRTGGVRSHRFAAANTALPVLHGDSRQLRAVTDFLQASGISLDFFALRPSPPAGAAAVLYAPLNRLPAMLRRGESARFDIVLRNRGVGHMFPGGKYVAQDCWLELQAVDDQGRTIFWSGRTAAGAAVDPGAHFFGGLWVDPQGRPLSGYEIWKNPSEVYTQRIEPNASALARFLVKVPADAGRSLLLTARLRYRKFRPDFTRWVFAERPGIAPEVPIVTLAESTLRLPVVDAGAPDSTRAAAPAPAGDWERWNDYAYALANQGDYEAARPAFRAALALRPGYAQGWTTLGNLEWAAADLVAARTALDRALALDSGQARARVVLGMMAQHRARYGEALADLRAAAAHFPRDADLWTEIGHTLLLTADYRAAVAAFDRALAINSENPGVHFMLTQAYRGLGDAERAQYHLKLFERFRNHGDSPAGARFAASDPNAGRERAGLHEHESLPLAGAPADAH